MNDRIIAFIESLGISTAEFERNCGLSNGAVAKMGDGTRRSTIDKISNIYRNLNKTWLLTGEGNMLCDSNKPAREEAEQSNKYDDSVIRYWEDMEATCGGVESFDDIKSGYVPLVLPDFRDCTDAVNIVGESMEPTYKSGSIILIKEWIENFIEYGNPYLIVTQNGNRMVKIINPGNDEGHITCKSINPNYAAFEIEKTDILRLYVVKGVISKIVM